MRKRANPNSYPNIEPSGFRTGEYVGYGLGSVWRIKCTLRNRKAESPTKWQAIEQNGTGRQIYAGTLQDLSTLLAQPTRNN